jgi:hypothetical protein
VDGQAHRFTRVTVEVPRHRSESSFWDQALGGLLLGNTRELLPDVKICLASAGAAPTCLPTCKDTPDCSQVVDLAFSGPLRMLLLEEDATNRDEIILDATIADPAACNPCRLEATGGIAEVYLETGPLARSPQPVAGCPSTLVETLACLVPGAREHDQAVCAKAAQDQRTAAATIQAWAEQDRLPAMDPATRLALLEKLVASPATAEATRARNLLYATAPQHNRDPEVWSGFAADIARIAPSLALPANGAWPDLTRNERRLAVERLIDRLLADLAVGGVEIRWEQSGNPFAWVEPAGRYDFVANEIVLSEGISIRWQRDKLLSGAIEESIHAWQGKIMRQYTEGEIEADGPLCRQARFFLANLVGYQGGLVETFNGAYQGQPLEVFAKDAVQVLFRHALR